MYLFRIWLGVTHYACIPEEIKYDINNHVINAQVKKQIKSKKGTYFCEIDTLRIGKCPSNSPFLKNNGAETPKEPRPGPLF